MSAPCLLPMASPQRGFRFWTQRAKQAAPGKAGRRRERSERAEPAVAGEPAERAWGDTWRAKPAEQLPEEVTDDVAASSKSAAARALLKTLLDEVHSQS
jgi:hypothetical protein